MIDIDKVVDNSGGGGCDMENRLAMVGGIVNRVTENTIHIRIPLNDLMTLF